ncbi:MAG: DUF5615 family PIN-like protein [Chloroflexota bacterium]|nr:DUF5615 family PIN-like protein [Chloroflexota bacterium]
MRLILDVHVPSAVARGLQATGIDVVTVATWLGGDIRTAADEDILTVATNENRVLVSYDTKTLRPLAGDWSELGRHHAGMIFIDDRTYRQNDIGDIVRALRTLVAERGDEDWQDQIAFL